MTLKTTAKEREEINLLIDKHFKNINTEMQRFANEIMNYKLRSEK